MHFIYSITFVFTDSFCNSIDGWDSHKESQSNYYVFYSYFLFRINCPFHFGCRSVYFSCYVRKQNKKSVRLHSSPFVTVMRWGIPFGHDTAIFGAFFSCVRNAASFEDSSLNAFVVRLIHHKLNINGLNQYFWIFMYTFFFRSDIEKTCLYVKMNVLIRLCINENGKRFDFIVPTTSTSLNNLVGYLYKDLCIKINHRDFGFSYYEF